MIGDPVLYKRRSDTIKKQKDEVTYMQINSVLKVIIVLLIIMILSLVGALFIIKRGNNEPADTDAVSTNETTVNDTTGSDTTSAENTSAGDTSAVVSDTTAESVNPPQTEPINPPQTEPVNPPQTEPVNPPHTDPIPVGFTFTKELTSDTGTKLNTRVVLTGVEEGGKIKLTSEMYLDYRSIRIGSRKGKLIVGMQTADFSSESIVDDSNDAHTKLLASCTQYVNYGDTVTVYATFPGNIVYSGINIGKIIISEDVLVK